MLCYVGRAVKETADRDSDSDNNVDDDLGRFAGVFIPVPRGRQIDINEHSIFSDSLGTGILFSFYVTSLKIIAHLQSVNLVIILVI